MSHQRQPRVKGGRTKRHEVWVTAEQEAQLLPAATRDGVTVAYFLAEAGVAVARAEDAAGMVETPTQRRRQLAELFALRHEIAEAAVQVKRVGTNVNQVAKGVHQGREVPVQEMRGFLADERLFLEESRRIVGRIDAVIDGIAGQGVGV